MQITSSIFYFSFSINRFPAHFFSRKIIKIINY